MSQNTTPLTPRQILEANYERVRRACPLRKLRRLLSRAHDEADRLTAALEREGVSHDTPEGELYHDLIAVRSVCWNYHSLVGDADAPACLQDATKEATPPPAAPLPQGGWGVIPLTAGFRALLFALWDVRRASRQVRREHGRCGCVLCEHARSLPHMLHAPTSVLSGEVPGLGDVEAEYKRQRRVRVAPPAESPAALVEGPAPAPEAPALPRPRWSWEPSA